MVIFGSDTDDMVLYCLRRHSFSIYLSNIKQKLLLLIIDQKKRQKLFKNLNNCRLCY